MIPQAAQNADVRNGTTRTELRNALRREEKVQAKFLNLFPKGQLRHKHLTTELLRTWMTYDSRSMVFCSKPGLPKVYTFVNGRGVKCVSLKGWAFEFKEVYENYHKSKSRTPQTHLTPTDIDELDEL